MSPFRERLLCARRQFLTSAASGVGGLALLALLRETGVLAAAAPQKVAKAKKCIFFFMEGGPSQFDLFSYKPKLNELNGQRPPEDLVKNKRFAFLHKDTAVLMGTSPKRTFTPRGQSGMLFSELVPNLGRHADRICLLQTVFTNQFNHHPAQLMMQTGDSFEGHPSMGSWLLYGLGTESQNLPGYVVMNSSAYLSGGGNLWQSGFLPTSFGGVLLQPKGNPVLDLAAPPGISSPIERRSLDALKRLNEMHQQKTMDPEIATRIANYELAFRMQAEAPNLTDLTTESAMTLARYGIDRPDPAIADLPALQRPPAGSYGNFARHCLLARRMVQRGVRFINIFSGSWDSHAQVDVGSTYFSGMIDQPIAALIDDLADLGLLDETLVVIAGEFGRTPLGQDLPDGPATGRDHHPDAFPVVMIGGGLKGGITYGETDELGWSPVKDPVDVADVHATILALFGIDHKALTFPFRGADERLTPLTRTARVLTDIIA